MENPKPKPSLIGVLFRPTEEFQKLRENPRILFPLIVLSVLYAVLLTVQSYVMFDSPYYTELLNKQLEGLPPGAEIDMSTMKTIGAISAAVTSIVLYPIGLLLIAFFFWIFTALFQGDASFKQLFSLSVYLTPITLLALLVNVLTTFLFGLNPMIPVTSLASLFSVEGTLQALLVPIEIFSIWMAVLVAMGMREVARISQTKAWIVGAIYFALSFIFTYVSQLLSGGM